MIFCVMSSQLIASMEKKACGFHGLLLSYKANFICVVAMHKYKGKMKTGFCKMEKFRDKWQ